MLSAVSKIRQSRIAAILLAVIGGLLILVTVFSVHPTASRFDSSALRPGSVGAASQPAPGTPTGQILPVEPFFDFSLVFPEQIPVPAR